MAFNLRIPKVFRQARWKVKIRDKESREPPHVTMLRGTEAWRINLRTSQFMDEKPNPTDVPTEIVEFIKRKDNWECLCKNWDEMYPNNPVLGVD